MTRNVARRGASMAGRLGRTAVLGVAALVAAAFVPASARALDPVLSDSEKKTTLVAMLEAWVPYAESYYVASPNKYFNVGGAGVSLERGEACIALVYATLLRAKPLASTFAGGIPRATIENHLEDAIDDVISSHDSRIGSSGWGGTIAPGNWQGPTIAAAAGWAAQLAWNTLDSTTKSDIEDIVAREANAVVDFHPQGYTTVDGGDSSLEENLNFAYVVAVGAAAFPSNPDADDWAEEAIRMTLNAASLDEDEASTMMIDGQTLGSWVETGTNGNLFDDYTMVNHGFFHPVYEQGLAFAESDMAAWYDDVGETIPAAFSWRMDTVWDEVLGYLAWDDGDIVAPATTDWVRHDYQHIEALAAYATREQRDDASVLESRAIELLQRRQNATGNGSLYGDVGYESDVMKTLAGAWLIHERFGPSPEPTTNEFNAAADDYYGVKVFEDSELIVSKHPDALATFSWRDDGDGEPMGLVVPSDQGHEDDPVLVSYETNSSIGGLTGDVTVSDWNCRCDQESMFSTAGTFSTPSGRKYSMTSFDDGSTLLLDRGTGETFGYDFENIDGIAEDRTIYDQTGEVGFGSYGPLTGSWANVDDRFGLIVKGGSGMYTEPRSNAFDSDWHHLTGDQGSGSATHRGALVLPNATHTQTASLAGDVRQPTVPNTSWSALTAIALDGTSRIAVANWGGSNATGTISNMSSSLGVPIPDRPNDVTVTGSTGATDFNLDGVNSTGEKGYFFVASSGSNTVTVRPISETLVTLTNGGASNTVTVKYDSGAGSVQTTSATLAAGTVAYAMAYNGGVAIVTPTASSSSGGQGAALAFDGSSSTYWSSASTALASPECLVLDMGASVTIGRLTMVPRSGHGPRDYKVQTATSNTTCSSETGWTTRATVTNSGDGTTKVHSWTPASARYVRIRATAAYGSSPYSVGVRELTPAPN